jgi:hypothetical protein
MDEEKIKNWLLPYFEKVCRKVFEGYMTQHGFKKTRLINDVALYYFHENTYLSLSYDIMDRPRYPVLIGIGLDKKSFFEGIGLWYTIPAYEKLDRSYWYFSNETELEINLTRIRDEIINVYAKPLWRDELKLETFIARWNQERIEVEKKEYLKNKKIEGSNAFKRGDFQKTVNIYYEIGIENLTAAESKRFEIAKKNIKK